MAKQTLEKIFCEELDQMLEAYYAAQKGEPIKEKLKNQIVTKVMPYVKKIAHGLARRSSDPMDDLIQMGNIGLLKAVDKYNPMTGTSFKTYATYLITGEMRHYLRDKVSMIKAPRQIYELYYRMNQIVHHLTDRLGRTPTDLEIADELQCPITDINQALELERRRQPISLDQFYSSEQSGNGETQYVERLVDEKYIEFTQNRENKILLDKALCTLKPEFREVVWMTYFQDMSQMEIASELGISQMQVSRRLRKAIDLLSQLLKSDERIIRGS